MLALSVCPREEWLLHVIMYRLLIENTMEKLPVRNLTDWSFYYCFSVGTKSFIKTIRNIIIICLINE